MFSSVSSFRCPSVLRSAGQRLFFFFTLFVFLFISLLPGHPAFSAGPVEEAADITRRCEITPASGRKNFSLCLDSSYKTFWRSNGGVGASILVSVPAGEYASGVWIQWYDHPHAAALQVQDFSGNWVDCAASEGVFLSDYLELPELTTAFRITNAPGVNGPMAIAELHIYGMGNRPADVQVWKAPAQKADLMIIAAHPDDEILWFGGMMPTYAGQRKKTCQVGILVPSLPRRRLELLDGLWTCGVTNYPVWGYFRDTFSLSLKEQYSRWDRHGVYKLITEWIRRFKPDVLATHDLEGEYGHGAHRVCADAVIHCLEEAASKKKYPDSAKEYGVWNVPKCYVHLYPENVVDLDWRVPLPWFDGKTGFEVAEEAFRCHVSQQHTSYVVEDFGPCDNSLFGLYRSLVGPDVEKNDLFENLN